MLDKIFVGSIDHPVARDLDAVPERDPVVDKLLERTNIHSFEVNDVNATVDADNRIDGANEVTGCAVNTYLYAKEREKPCPVRLPQSELPLVVPEITIEEEPVARR